MDRRKQTVSSREGKTVFFVPATINHSKTVSRMSSSDAKKNPERALIPK